MIDIWLLVRTVGLHTLSFCVYGVFHHHRCHHLLHLYLYLLFLHFFSSFFPCVDLSHDCAFVCLTLQGLCDTAANIYSVAVQEHEHKGVTGAVGGVLRQIPSAVIEPVIIATEATSNVLGGMRNQLLPDRKLEDDQKWKQTDSD